MKKNHCPDTNLYRRSAAWILTLGITLGGLPFSVVLAKDFTESQVKAAVETWVQKVTADAKPDAAISRLEPQVVGGQIVSYVAHLAGGGFCLCGSDDQALPVYLYSPNGTYDPAVSDLRTIQQEIAARRMAMRDMKQRPVLTRAISPETLSVRSNYWQELIAGRVPANLQKTSSIGEFAAAAAAAASALPTSLVLPLTSQWHQGSPYNDLCPILIPGSDFHALVGCVPTAAAQIMRFWQWPVTGVGSATGTPYPRRYSADWVEEPLAANPNIPANWHGELGQGTILEWTAAGGGKLKMRGYWDVSIANDATTLNMSPAFQAAIWVLFSNRLLDVGQPIAADFGAATYNWGIMKNQSSDPPDAAAAEAAKLCFHLGIAIQSWYGVSLTTSSWLTPALKTYFRYDPDATTEARTVDRLTEELQWYRPVVLRNPPHAWVAYGYNMATDPDRQFLMNLGWGPNAFDHVWLSLDAIPAPADQPVSNLETRIAPAGAVRFVGSDSPSGDGSPGNPYLNLDSALGAAPDHTTLIFKAGSLNASSQNPLTISRALTLKGFDATITR